MIGLKGVFSGQGPLRIQLFPVIGLNDWTNVPSRDWAHILDPSLWGRQRVPCGPLPPDRPAEHICLSWAFFPFTHSLCRDARQISIIHKQLSYLPQRMNQVCVYWFKINNLHSWRGGTFCWLTALHLDLQAGSLLLSGKLEDECKWALENLEKVLWFYFELTFSVEMDKPGSNILTSEDQKWKICVFDREGLHSLFCPASK